MCECEKYKKLSMVLLKTEITGARVINAIQDFFEYDNNFFRIHMEFDSVLPLDELEDIFTIDTDIKRDEFYNEIVRITNPNIEIDINLEVNKILDKYIKLI